MFCNSCGHSNPNGASFCSKCGTGLQASTAHAGAPQAVLPTPMTMVPLGPAFEGAGASRAAFPAHPGPRNADAGTGAFDDEACAVIVGANADYYVPRFRAMTEGGAIPRWHWPAFFVTWYWLLYRKLWGLSFLYLFATWILTAFAGAVAGAASDSPAAGVLTLVMLAAFYLIPPLIANSLYFRHCRKKMEAARRVSRSRDGFLAALRTSGGTSSVVVIIASVLAVIFFIGIVAAVSLPAYQDYTKRAKTAEAALFGRQAVEALVQHYRQTRQIPEDIETLAGTPAKPASVSSVEVDANSGIVTVRITGLGDMEFTPHLKGETLTVGCASPNIDGKMLPAICR